MNVAKTCLLLSMIVLFLGCQKSKEVITEKPFTDFLEYGEYNVGFKTLFASDPSREGVPFTDWSGKLYPDTPSTEARNLPIHIWYPTNEVSEPLPYRHFANLATRQTQDQPAHENDSLAKHIFAYQSNELGRTIDPTDAEIEILFELTTKSSYNVEPVQQKFPLIIFPNGSSPANQSVMCEFWASHGYIVAAISLKGQFSSVIDASVKGLEVAVDDLEFALQKLLELPNVDVDQIALAANAIESSFSAGLASRNKKIKALVSIDGGLPSRFEQDILSKTNFYEPHSVSIPILILYTPHPSISPHFIYDLKYSERLFARFPEMSEFHFLNYALFEEHVPNIIGEPKGDVKKGFKAASELTLSFLNAQLKNQAEPLDHIYSGGIPKQYEKTIDTLFRLDGLRPPPNIAVMKHLFVAKGMKAIDSVYQSQVAQGDQQPFPMSFFTDFRNWLAWKKDPEHKNRLRLYKLAVDSYPNLAANNYRLAYYLKLNDQLEAAMPYYEKTKKLLPQDSTLTPSQKRALKMYIAEDLQ